MKQSLPLLLLIGFFLKTSLLSAQFLLEPEVDSIPMRDGKTLAADIYHPVDCDSCPTLLIQTPYNRKLYRIGLPLGIGKDVDTMPFHVVIVDWRGFWGSLAAWKLNPKRGEDGYDVVEWIAAQAWSNGKVGTLGPSALGNVQYLTIKEHPPHLVCAIPEVSEPQFAYSEYYPGGVYRQEYGDQLDALGFNLSGILLANPVYNPLWSTTEASTFYPEEISIPTFLVGGWYDHNIEQSLDFFSAMQQQSPDSVRHLHKFLIGPWVHGGSGPARLGSVNQGELQFPLAGSWKDSLEWMFLNHYLIGDTNVWEEQASIMYYQMGEHLWEETPSWPPVHTEESWYLQADGSLSTAPASNGTFSFPYDPRDPSPTHGGTTLRVDQLQGPYDQRDTVENRLDILLFDSPVLSKAVRVHGQIQVQLFVSSDRPDTDIAVRLSNVYPDGRSILLTDDIHRMRFRDGFTASDTMNMIPGQVYQVKLTLADLAHTFMPGHQIRLAISGANYPKYALNLNNGGPMYEAGDTLTATNTIHTGSTYPSKLIIPVTPSVAIEKSLSSSKLLIYPNPVGEVVSVGIKTEETFNTAQTYKISLLNMKGQRVCQKTVHNLPVDIPMAFLPSGIYLIEVNRNGQLLQEKLIKE